VRRLCKVLGVHPSRFYAWRLNPESERAEEDKRLLATIKESWLESGSAKPPASITWAYGKGLCAGRFSEHRSRGTPDHVLAYTDHICRFLEVKLVLRCDMD
jgi:hypothetical protein